ncbi:MAG: alpha/beta fold hydrolase [Proteobacteria bacterium]|nr:alpha/beta fold hydrolase [Pseudomonadota bacterium]
MSGAAAVDVSPFDLGPRNGAAALCLHGLTGTPYEVRPLGEALAANGIRARGPVLPGHNATPEELARVPYTAWVDAARDELEGLRVDHADVFVVGLSMGGLVTLALAAEGGVPRIAVVATPLRFRAPIPLLISLVRHVKPFLRKGGGSDIRDEAARARHPSYPAMPLESVHQLIQLQARVRSLLSRIEVPALVAHGRHDKTASPDDAHTLHRELAKSELLFLEDSAHVVPVDHDGPRLAEAVVAFLTR